MSLQFSAAKETILKAVNYAAAAATKKGTMPILENALLELEAGTLTITCSDLELEMKASIEVQAEADGATTVGAHKLASIIKNLPDGSIVNFTQQDEKLIIKSGRSRFTMATLPADTFPHTTKGEVKHNLVIEADKLNKAIQQGMYAIANNDVRYYLNGLYFDFEPNLLNVVATDGHRMSCIPLEINTEENASFILPKKGVTELNKLLGTAQGEITLTFTDNHLHTSADGKTLTSKLIDGRFPDYKRVIPKENNSAILADKYEFKALIQRAAILSNEKFKGVRLEIEENTLTATAANPEGDDAVISMQVQYSGEKIEIGFNTAYLQDTLNAIEGGEVLLKLKGVEHASALILSPTNPEPIHVLMPMRSV